MKAGSYLLYLSCINRFFPLFEILEIPGGSRGGCWMPVAPQHSEPLSTGMMQPWDIQQARRGTGKAVGIWNQTGAM